MKNPWRRRLVAGSLAMFALIGAGVPEESRACDLCAIYMATAMRQRQTGPRLGIGVQYTNFDTLQDGGDPVSNPNNEHMDSTILQLLVGYGFKPWLGVQMNVPIIVRDFRRLAGSGVENGTESGFGDLSLIADVVPYTHVGLETVFTGSLFAGLKLPSGSSRRLEEEVLEEGDLAIAGEQLARHDTGEDEAASGIHGHDLALGSGSVDGVIGARVFGSWERLFFSGTVQYMLRTTGSFDYRYADDLLWRAGPGVFLLTGHKLGSQIYSLRARAVLSGETKGKDRLDGSKVDDTAMTSMFAGPGFVFTWGPHLAADFEVEIPVVLNNTDLQIVPDYRVRGGLVWRF